jgi:hypothetical protein
VTAPSPDSRQVPLCQPPRQGLKLVPFHRLSPHKHRYERSGLDVAVHTPEAGNDFNDYKCGNAHRVAIGIAPIC